MSNSSRHHRAKYESDSNRFLEWAHSFSVRKSFFHRFLTTLNQEFSLKYLLYVYLFSFALSVLMFFRAQFPYNLQMGEKAPSTILSPIAFQMIDEVTTEDKKLKAENESPPFFDLDTTSFDRVSMQLTQAFREMRDLLDDRGLLNEKPLRGTVREEILGRKSDFEKILGVTLPEGIFAWLVEKKFSHNVEGILLRNLEAWYQMRILDAPEKLLGNYTQFVAREVLQSSIGRELHLSRDSVVGLQDASHFTLQNKRGLGRLRESDRTNLLSFARLLVTPNLTLNKKETAYRRQQAREAVLPVNIEIKKNQVIVTEGMVVQPFHVAIARQIEVLQSDKGRLWMAFVMSMVLTISAFVFVSYLRRFSNRRIKIGTNELTTMMVVTLIVVVLTKFYLFVADEAFADKVSNWFSPGALLYMAPVAAAPMMIGLLVSVGELIWIYTIFFSISVGVMAEFNFAFMMMSLVGGVAAARGVHICRRRNDIYRAGVRTGIINFMIVFLMMTLLGFEKEWNVQQVFASAVAGFLGGILSAFLTQVIVPILESVFHVTTDVKLLELSNLNHPLLREMIVKAPGTYHHSIMVGSMVEAAAEEIGANPLLGKVMCYYHDIGKIAHPEYYIENQKPGQNPHDHISPYMSKTLLIAHVKDGVELGIKHRLGQPIIDGILQHHGTTVISFFYNKALESAKEGCDPSSLEAEFRYPGPKPQYPETALCMLADSIEAAARSLDDPTPARLSSIIHNIIQKKLADGQLSECQLSLEDLHKIENAFVKILLGIYHQRIDYPRITPIRQGARTQGTKA